MQYKRVHFIGAGGIGTSAMAKLLKSRGTFVSGSDLHDSETLQELRDFSVQVWVGSHPEKIGKDVELIVYSSAVPEEDEERIRGRHIGARETTYNAFLGEVSAGMRVIAVTGTHGKSTTTAMIGHVLIEAGLDPTVVVGSKVPGFLYGNLRIGASDLFVAEACEHQEHMLYLEPWIAVVNNIEFDHPDYYRDLDHVFEAMVRFGKQVSADGVLMINGAAGMGGYAVQCAVPDTRLINMPDGLHATSEQADRGQTLTVYRGSEKIGSFTLHLPGSYNVENAMMAWAVAEKLDVPSQTIAKALGSFQGLWRRFEHLGAYKGADVYSDYAHHPTAIVRLLEGTRRFLPGRRIVLCFQPHQHARTKGLFDAFVGSMDAADVVILLEIYGVAGRMDGEQAVSSADLAAAIRAHDTARGVERPVVFAKDLADAKAKIDGEIKAGDVLLMTGAGDIDGLARALLSLSLRGA